MSSRFPALNGAYRRRGELGQDLVEFAVVLPLLLGLLLGICEFGMLVSDYNTVANASREGARFGISHPALAKSGTWTCSSSSTGAVGAACKLTYRLTAPKVSVTITTSASTPSLTVKVTYQTKLLTAVVIEALGGKSDVTLAASSTMRWEQ